MRQWFSVSQLINLVGLFLGFWLGGYFSQRLKGRYFVAVTLGAVLVFLANQLLPYAYTYPSSRNNNISGDLAGAAYSMIFVTGAVIIKDGVIALWMNRRRKRQNSLTEREV